MLSWLSVVKNPADHLLSQLSTSCSRETLYRKFLWAPERHDSLSDHISKYSTDLRTLGILALAVPDYPLSPLAPFTFTLFSETGSLPLTGLELRSGLGWPVSEVQESAFQPPQRPDNISIIYFHTHPGCWAQVAILMWQVFYQQSHLPRTPNK